MAGQGFIELPLPPSLNNVYANGKGGGRFKAKHYEAWQTEAGWALNLSTPKWKVPGPVNVRIYLPTKMQGDIDNRIKPLLDLLVAHGRIDDDRNVVSLEVRKTWHDGKTCSVDVWRAPS